MSSIRQNKISKLVQKALGELFQRESISLFDGAFITVTLVRISPDLSVAKTYISLYAVKDKETILEKIKLQHKEIRRRIGEKLRNQLRIIPELQFFIDDSLDYAEKIENLLKK